jgi:hypothetical protein
MAVGLIIARADVDAAAGSLALQLNVTMKSIGDLKAWLDTQTDPNLIALAGNPSYTQADVNLLRSAVGDLEQLRTIYQGTVALAVPKDFRTFAKQIFKFGYQG